MHRITQEKQFHFLDSQGLEGLAPLLSKESYRNLQKELKRLKENPPPASGLGNYHLNYIPRTEKEALEKARWLQARQLWITRCCSIYEMLERSARREKRKVEEENQKLKEENKALKDALQRTRNQLQTVLGFKKSKRTQNPTQKNTFPEKKKRGAPKGHIGKTRPKPDKVDRIDIIAPPDKCPHCGDVLILAGNEYVSKYIEDIPPIVKTVTERRYKWGTCSCCKQQVVHPEALTGPQVVIGENLVAQLAVMRQQLGATYRKLSTYCTEILGLPLSPSGVLGIISRVSEKLEPVYKGIESALPSQSVLHGDETGWKMDGDRWYLWSFCNKNLVYFHLDSSRSAQVPKAIVGEDYSGIMHADFYAGYNFFHNTQRCLIHLLRDIKQELEISKKEKSLCLLKKGIKFIIEKGQLLKKVEDSQEKNKKRQQLEDTLTLLGSLSPTHSKAKTLSKRIARHHNDLLRFVDHKDVEYHNNRAERAIRPAVIFRKISFGNRSPEGARNYSILASVLETCRLKNENLPNFIQTAWTTPTDQIHHLSRALLDTS